MLILSELRKGCPSQVSFHALGIRGAASKPRPLGPSELRVNEGGYRVPYFGACGVVAGRRIWRARSRQDALRDSGQAGATNHGCVASYSNLP
jgi:hypothetical protein